jgi:hypothetical protein
MVCDLKVLQIFHQHGRHQQRWQNYCSAGTTPCETGQTGGLRRSCCLRHGDGQPEVDDVCGTVLADRKKDVLLSGECHLARKCTRVGGAPCWVVVQTSASRKSTANSLPTYARACPPARPSPSRVMPSACLTVGIILGAPSNLVGERDHQEKDLEP